MNLNCCITEDEKIYQNELKLLLKEWADQAGCSVSVASAVSDREIYALPFQQYDIIFIDIALKDSVNGIEIARVLRARNYSGEIVFLTNFREYVLEGYPVSAMDYLLKPVSAGKIYHCMDRLLEKRTDRYFIFHQKSGILQIPYEEILYFSSQNHITNVVTVHKTYQITQALHRIFESLPGQFSQCHRTLIVNTTHIIRLNPGELTLSSGECLPVGKSHQKQLQQKILDRMRS